MNYAVNRVEKLPYSSGAILHLKETPRNRRAERQRRAEQLKARFRTVCGCLAALFLLLAIGYGGYVEQGGDTATGFAGMFVSIALFCVFGTLSGAVVW